MANVSAALKKLAKAWKEAEPQGARVPDDSYTGKIVAMELTESGSGNLQCVTTFKCGKREVKKFDGLKEENLGWFKSYCEVIGLEFPDDITKLEKAIAAFVEEVGDVTFNLVVKTNAQDFQNVRVTGVNDGSEDGDDTTDDDEDSEDESCPDEDREFGVDFDAADKTCKKCKLKSACEEAIENEDEGEEEEPTCPEDDMEFGIDFDPKNKSCKKCEFKSECKEVAE